MKILFYNPNNIFVWDKNSKEILSSFFDSPYEELEKSIYEKYSLKIGSIHYLRLQNDLYLPQSEVI